ncbi:MAG: histidine kinase [Deltaproteobacteria bacterium RBG_16_54_11]|nr:MAG: histidine kinase [Deltaproteobacteria bacterium RBG_16_54_11]
MQDLSLHILDIVENSVASKASQVAIRITEDLEKEWMTLEIEDNGAGISPDLVERVVDPFFTTRSTRRVGLGLSLLQQAARACEGDLKVRSRQGKGTLVRATFRYHHIDCKPLGDIASTLVALIVGNPSMDFRYVHSKGDKAFCLDTVEIKRELEDVPIDHPKVVQLIRDETRRGLEELGYHF